MSMAGLSQLLVQLEVRLQGSATAARGGFPHGFLSPPTKGQIYGFSMNRETKSGGSVSRGIKAMTKYRTFRRMRAPPARYYEAKGGTISLRRKKSKNSCAQRRKGKPNDRKINTSI